MQDNNQIDRPQYMLKDKSGQPLVVHSTGEGMTLNLRLGRPLEYPPTYRAELVPNHKTERQ